MSDVAQVYTRSVYENFHPLYANWEPSRPIQLGDYGLLRGRHFVYVGNVHDKAIPFEVRDENRKDHKLFASKGLTEVKFNAKGSDPATGLDIRATLEVKFSSTEAVFLNAAECSYRMIRDKFTLGQAIMKESNKGKWDSRWVVVTDLVDTGATTVAVSGGETASIVFEATGDVANINLADASLGFKAKTSTNVGYQMESSQGLTPLFGLCKIQRAFPWIHSGFEPLSATDEHDFHDDLARASDASAQKKDRYFGQLP